ncbi:MAG: DMT family transporter, partial [Pseudomonadota bacterium]
VSTGAVFTLTPIMSAVFGWLLMRQITTGSMALALALAGGGALWVIFRGDIAALISLRFGPGEQLFLIGCMAHALYTPLVRLTRREEPVRVYTFGMLCGGLLFTGIYSTPDVLATDWAVLPPVAWVGILYLGVFTTAITALLLQFAALRLPAAKVMAYGYLVPTFVIIEEGLIGNGWIAPIVWLGVAGTIAGLLILLRED